MSQHLHRRALEYRRRLALRSWEYRQRNLARGVWSQLRSLLADAAQVYVISDDDARTLEAGGAQPAPVGSRLEPEKRVFVISASRAQQLPNRREIGVRLSAELLAARNLVLIPFASGTP